MVFCGELMYDDIRYEKLRADVIRVRNLLKDYAYSSWNEVHPKEYHALERKEVRLTRCLMRALNFRTRKGLWV